MNDALCAEIGPGLFYAENSDYMLINAAKDVCNLCPVIHECAEHAITHEVHGV